MTVTADSACNSPANSSVWSPSSSNPSTRTFTCRIWRSVGSSQCFFSWSIAFNSLMVVVCMTSTMRSPPSKVFTFSSRRMTSMAARESSTRYGRRLRCVLKMWGALKSTASLLRCTIDQRETNLYDILLYWLVYIGILIMAWYNPHITGSQKTPLIQQITGGPLFTAHGTKKWRFPNFEP